uniref:Cytochrome C n=1 Tax=Thermodesulfovibrio aggregans TaxID=86166 RepID=A0A7C4AJW0_9BACT
MKVLIIFIFILICPFITSAEYIGSEACKRCHLKQYENFIQYSRMSRSWEAIEKMGDKISQDELKGCYQCHTTGYGKKEGFVSLKKTPHLKNAGCEVCHGPGKKHAETKNPEYIRRKFSLQICEPCHTEERIKAFRFKPLLYGGAH